MNKAVSHLVVLVIGAAGGIYWGVNHPQNAQRITDIEQRGVDKVAQGVETVKQHLPGAAPAGDQTAPTVPVSTPVTTPAASPK